MYSKLFKHNLNRCAFNGMAVRNNIVSSRAEVETYDALIKLILIGNSSVGKTCLILRYVENTYQKNFLPTIGKLHALFT